MKRTLLTLALVASAGAAYAQTAEPTDPYGRPLVGRNDWVRQPLDRPGPATGPASQATAPVMTPSVAAPSMDTMSPGVATAPAPSTLPATAEPRDPYGRPLIGRNDWVAQPGDRVGRNPATAAPAMASGMPVAAPAATMSSGPREATFKDEYGFRYDAQGHRLDARGNIISPQTR